MGVQFSPVSRIMHGEVTNSVILLMPWFEWLRSWRSSGDWIRTLFEWGIFLGKPIFEVPSQSVLPTRIFWNICETGDRVSRRVLPRGTREYRSVPRVGTVFLCLGTWEDSEIPPDCWLQWVIPTTNDHRQSIQYIYVYEDREREREPGRVELTHACTQPRLRVQPPPRGYILTTQCVPSIPVTVCSVNPPRPSILFPDSTDRGSHARSIFNVQTQTVTSFSFLKTISSKNVIQSDREFRHKLISDLWLNEAYAENMFLYEDFGVVVPWQGAVVY